MTYVPSTSPPGQPSLIERWLGNLPFFSSRSEEPVQRGYESLLFLYDLVYSNKNFLAWMAFSFSEKQHEFNGGWQYCCVHPFSNTQRLAGRLLPLFLQVASLLSLDPKHPRQLLYAKQCFIILACMLENNLLHAKIIDGDIKFAMSLMRMERGVEVPNHDSWTLCGAIMEIAGDYLHAHYKKMTFLDLTSLALGIFQRIMLYQQKHRERIPFAWPRFWQTLFLILKAAAFNRSHFERYESATIVSKAIDTLNFLVCFGDVILPDEALLMQFLYELTRNKAVIDSVQSLASDWTLRGAVHSLSELTNLFLGKVEAWMLEHPDSSADPKEILHLIEATLPHMPKNPFNIDTFAERFVELPRDATYLKELVRVVIKDYRAVALLESTSADT